MNEKVKKLIKKSYDKNEANKASSFIFSDKAKEKLIERGKDVLQNYPYHPGLCASMSALWAALIRDNTDYPIHAVAGSLFIDDYHAFGRDESKDNYKNAFLQSNKDWDGHCWVVIGEYIGDISLFRSAYSKKSSKKLKNKIISKFGKKRGLFVAQETELKTIGLKYEPLYVIKNNEITSLVKGALAIFDNNK